MADLLPGAEDLLCEVLDGLEPDTPNMPELRMGKPSRSGSRYWLYGRQKKRFERHRPASEFEELKAAGFLRKLRTDKSTGTYFAFTPAAFRERDAIKGKRAKPTVPALPQQLDTNGWVLDEQELDSGANSRVYLARKAEATAVLKICSSWRPESERYQRFVAEIDALREFAEEPGVMPMLDAAVPGPGKGQFPWYVMPEAMPLSKLRPDTSLHETVDGLASIAETLRKMHDRGYSHRDVKPSNLFLMADGAYVVGDLGLVGVPDEIRRSLTREGNSLGPTNFMAPEMREYTSGAEARPADVYSLAKSLWAIVAKRRFPLPGHQRADDHESLAALTGEVGAADLDRLIEEATEHDPDRRPSMAEVAAGLRAWAEADTGAEEDEEDELDAAIAEARARLSNQLGEAQSEAANLRSAEESFARLIEALNPLFTSLPKIGATNDASSADQMLDATLGHPFLEAMGMPLIVWRNQAFAYAQIGPEHDGVRLAIACGTVLFEGGTLSSAVGILVYGIPPTLGSDGFAWHDVFEARVASLSAEQETTRLAREAKEQMPMAITSFMDLAERP